MHDRWSEGWRISVNSASASWTRSSRSRACSMNATGSVAEAAPQRRCPALVLLEQPAEALPARLGELELRVVAVEDLEASRTCRRAGSPRARTPARCSGAPAPLQPVQRRLGDVHVAGLDQRLHLAEQQRQHERPDVGAVDVGVGQHDHLVVARLVDVELVAHAGADRGDQRLDLGVREDLVDPALLDVEDLAAQRQDRLGVAVTALLGRAAGRVALDHEQLGQRRDP